ncbi:tape measure protein, partial [Escherichia albertii]|nr:tape measure protein [Escherichia albertii]MCZ9102186.1 tape measure protein [Escherichia albertii]MCZ9125645.1 tape measure protein [Escherichia albertii]
MAQFKVDDFLIELSFNSQKVLKGLEKVEKQTMQIASRIEKRLNKAFKVNPAPLNDSLKVMEKNVDKTISKIEQRLKNTKAFKIKTEIEDTLKPLRQPRQPRISGNRAITAAHSSNMSKLNSIDPLLAKMFKAQYYNLSNKAKTLGNEAFNRELAKLNQNLRETLSKFNKTTSKNNHSENASNSLDVLATSAIKAGTAIYSFQTALEAYRKVMEIGLKKEASQRAAQFVLGDEGAKRATEFVKSLANNTGVDQIETLSSYAKFSAGAGNMDTSQKESLFSNVIGTSRLMGLSTDEINGILKAFEQMASKGKIQAEELRGQLGDRMAGAFQLFARSLGMTTEELDKAMKDGKVLSKDVLPKVSAEMGKMIDKAGGWEKIINSTQTQLGRLSNEWNNNLALMFDGSQEGLTDFTRSLTNLLNSLGGQSKNLGEHFGDLMKSMSHGVDSLTDISYRVRAFFDEVTLAYRSLDDTQKKIVDGLTDGLIDGLKMLAVAVTAQKAANVAGGLLNLANAVTSFGDAVNKAKAGKAGSSGGALSKVGRVVLYAELVNFALDNLNPEAAKNPNLHQSGIGTETNFNPEYKGNSAKPNQINEGWAKIGSSIAGWFNNAATKIAGFQEPMNNFVNNTQPITPTITGGMVNINAQLAMAVSELGKKVDTLTTEIRKPVAVSISGEATIRPDEPAFFRFTQSANDQFT